MTGCLSACKKYKVALSNDDVSSSGEVDTQSGASETLLSFTVNDGYYVEEEQYVIYDVNSFIADVGGYMGLLLGSSLLSLYMTMEDYVTKALANARVRKAKY